MFQVLQNNKPCSEYKISNWTNDTFLEKSDAEVYAFLWAYPHSLDAGVAIAPQMELDTDYDYSMSESDVMMKIVKIDGHWFRRMTFNSPPVENTDGESFQTMGYVFDEVPYIIGDFNVSILLEKFEHVYVVDTGPTDQSPVYHLVCECNKCGSKVARNTRISRAKTIIGPDILLDKIKKVSNNYTFKTDNSLDVMIVLYEGDNKAEGAYYATEGKYALHPEIEKYGYVLHVSDGFKD